MELRSPSICHQYCRYCAGVAAAGSCGGAGSRRRSPSFAPKTNESTNLSLLAEGMEDNRRRGSAASDTRYDRGGPNHVKLPYNKCGE